MSVLFSRGMLFNCSFPGYNRNIPRNLIEKPEDHRHKTVCVLGKFKPALELN